MYVFPIFATTEPTGVPFVAENSVNIYILFSAVFILQKLSTSLINDNHQLLGVISDEYGQKQGGILNVFTQTYSNKVFWSLRNSSIISSIFGPSKN